ncbi:DUF3857 domain-containing protein [Pedobacter sp. JCM 36344]|uniref:DUF3857 domain-containing protein n=1 Tax=Pedobacter sp. JCM 36344 TaxID=3374280 RepID=UPI003978F55E
MKHIYLFFFLSTLSLGTMAQDFTYGGVSGSDINLTNTRLDSNANAMVINEYGAAAMQLDYNDGHMYINFVYHVRIKIFNKNGFENGNVVIPLRTYTENEDSIDELKATTFNFVDGKLLRYELDQKKIFNEKRNKYVSLKKFTMPNLVEGSVIEYSYLMRIPTIFNFKSWEFQSSIPKLRSEFVSTIPAIYNYNVSLRGAKKLTSTKAELQKECLVISGMKADCSKMTYIMTDVPAFIQEDYMTAPDNFKSAIYYELSDYTTASGSKTNITKTWRDVDNELLDDKSFGAQLKRKDLFIPLLPAITREATDHLSKAKAIYTYIGRSIKSNHFIGIRTENGIKKALETRSGNVGDINLALVTALNAAGMDAEALILSTRQNGLVNSLYPVISEFNYVIAKLNLGDQTYLLDASEPQLPFGLIPLNCVNGNGRAIGFKKKASYWYEIRAPQKETTKYILEAALDLSGNLKGLLTTYSMGYAALNKRAQIGAAGSVDEYVEKLDEQMPNIKILNHVIENLDTLENALVEKYEIEMKVFENMNFAQLYFNPFFINRTSKNPFNLNERTYPVDMGAAREERVTMMIKLPENLYLAEQPKNVSMALPENGGKFMSNTTLMGNTLTFTQVFQLNKPIYSPEEYLALKEFYSRMIQLQKTDIILKKAK